VAGSHLTRVLIDGGSSLNLLFVSTLKKMGLDISKILTPSMAPFYGIVLGNTATSIDSVTLPVTFGKKLPYRVHQVRGGKLRVLIPCHPRQTCFGQIHGRTPLHLPAPQDAGQDRGPHLPRRLEEVLQLRSRGNRVHLDYTCTRAIIQSFCGRTTALLVRDGDSSCTSIEEAGPVDGEAQHQRHRREDHPTAGG
jgi:hypothetical protein